MNEPQVEKIDEVQPYAGPNTLPGIAFRPAGRQLGLTAWGMNVLDLEPGCESYPEHDHGADGQEEVYVVLSGSGTLVAGGRRWPLESGTMARVPPTTTRKIVPGPHGLRLLALGATPGKAYEPKRG